MRIPATHQARALCSRLFGGSSWPGRHQPHREQTATKIGRSISRIDGAVAGAVSHQYVRKCIGSAMFEAAAYLLDVIHAEKDVERAVDVQNRILRSDRPACR